LRQRFACRLGVNQRRRRKQETESDVEWAYAARDKTNNHFEE
jgi:hypothetical protein